MATLDLTNIKAGDHNLFGQTYLAPRIQGIHGDPANPIRLFNGTLIAPQILNSSHIIIDGLTVRGDDTGAAIPTLTGGGIFARWCNNLSILGCDVSRAQFGIRLLDTVDSDVVGNDVHDLRTDAYRYVNVERTRFRWNSACDWFPAVGDHCDFFQGWNNGPDHPSVGVEISDNCAWRGKSANVDGSTFAAMGINDRYYALPRQGYVDLQILRNLLIGLAWTGMELYYDVTASENEKQSFHDKISRLMATGTIRLSGNKAADYVVGKVNLDTPPAGNFPRDPINPSEADALVSAWKTKRAAALGVVTPAPVPVPTPIPAPVEPAPEPIPAPVDPAPVPLPDVPPVAFTAAQTAKVLEVVSAAIAAL